MDPYQHCHVMRHKPKNKVQLYCAFKSELMRTRLNRALRKSTTQWPDQIRLYHSTVQQLPRVACKRHVQFLYYFLCVCCFLVNRNNMIKNCTSTSHRNKEISQSVLYMHPSTVKIGTGNGNGFFIMHCIAIVCFVFYSQASHTTMDSNKSTALFEIPRLSAQQGGLWECRVSTNGGQDSHKFNLTIKGLSEKI